MRPDGDGAAAILHAMLGDGKAQTGAAGFTRTRRIDTVEPFENAVERILRNADALVHDTDRHFVGVLAGAVADRDGDRGVLRRVVDGVLHQILHRGFDGVGVGFDIDGFRRFCGIRGDIAIFHRHGLAVEGQHQRDVLRIRLHLVFRDGLARDVQCGQALRIEHRRGALRLLQVDETMDQFRQPLGFLGDTAGEILDRIGVVGGVADGFGKQ